MRLHCVACGILIKKPGKEDPYLCRTCEQNYGIELQRYGYLDS